MKEDKNIYEKSYFIDMESEEKDYKKKKKKEQNKKSYATSLIVNVLIIVGIVILILIFFVFFYKPNAIDYLGEIKNTFTYGMITILGIITILMIIFHVILKDKKMLSHLLKILLFFNIICLIVFFYIDAILDKTYNNEESFGNIYETKIENKTDTEYIDLWKTFSEQEVKTKTEKEVFIEENMTQYRYFKIRVYLILILYVILMMANTYRISKIDKGIKARESIEKNDKILFKNEKNVH